MPKRRPGRVVLSRRPWRVMRPSTRHSSLGRLSSTKILTNSMASKELIEELTRQVSSLVVRSSADLGKRSSVDLGTTIGRENVAKTLLERLPKTPLERFCVFCRISTPQS